MLRSTVRKISLNVKNVRFSSNQIAESLEKKPKSLNLAKMIGTISSDVFNNVKHDRFHLKTVNPDKSYETHKIIVYPKTLQHLPEKLSIGKQVLVVGRLSAGKFLRDNGKNGTEGKIQARQIYFLDENAHSETAPLQNQNLVELYGRISFEVLEHEKFTVFQMAYNYIKKNEHGVVQGQTDFFPIFVYDKSILQNIRGKLQRKDRVLVKGQLRYKSEIDDAKRRKYSCYIEAKSINKLISAKDAVESMIHDSNKSINKLTHKN